MSSLWLPLNGDLHNQGISGIIVTGTNVSINTAGKIGSCYSFNGSSSYIELNSALCSNETTEFSYACWVKFNSTASCCLFSNRTAVDSNGVTLFVNNNGNILFDIGKERHTKAYTFSTGTWYHLAFTYKKGATKKIYVNGAEIYSAGTSGTMTSAAATKSFIGASQNTSTTVNDNYLNGYLNDVRIWNDHALSAAEVHEIAQGLVLHYKLDDTYAETTTNLYSGTFSNTCYNGATGKYGYGTTTDIYKTTENFQGKESVKVYMGTAGLSAYPYIYFDAFNTAGTAVHTLSFDYYPTSQTSIIPYSYNGSYNISYITSNGAHDSKTNISSITIPVVINQWNHIAITMQKYDTTNTSRGNGYIRIGSASHTSTTSDYWLFANIQVEAKDHETGYTAPGTTRSNVQIQDSSGYGNNGIINSNPIISLETARYNYSISFDGVDDCIKIPFNDIIKDKNYTVSVWTYKTSIGTKNYQTILGGPSGFELEARSSSSTSPLYRIHNWGGGTTAYEFNKWNLFTFVHTDSNSKLYVNGELKITGTSANIPTGNYYIGAWNSVTGQNYEGLMSDFRIYCTALSAADILELYHTGAKIDNKQNLHTFEVKEQSENMFRSELIMPWAKPNRTRIGEIVEHNGYMALNIAPEPFYNNISNNTGGALDGMFQAGSYVFDIWVDVDSVISGGTNRDGGMVIRYSDNTSENAFVFTGGNLGYQHKIYITPANKTIQRLEFYYYTSTDVFYRIDSCIYSINEAKIFKSGIVQSAGFLEDTKSRIIKNGLIETNEIIEL